MPTGWISRVTEVGKISYINEVELRRAGAECDEGGEQVWGRILHIDPRAGYEPLWYCSLNPSGWSQPKPAEQIFLFVGLWIKIWTWGERGGDVRWELKPCCWCCCWCYCPCHNGATFTEHFTGNSISFYLTFQFIQQLLQLVDLRAPVLLILDAALWNHNYIIYNSL